MISDDNVTIRYAVAQFALEYYFEADTSKSKKKSSSSASSADNKKHLKTLLTFMEQRTKHPEQPNYVIDSFWGRVGSDFLRDFAAMAELFTADSRDAKLTDSERTLLANVINCCVRRTVGQKIVPKSREAPFGRDKDEEKRQESISAMGTTLAKALPDMLGKYKNEAGIVSALAEIPQYIPIDIYTTFRLQSSFKDLLKHLSESFLKIVDVEVFMVIAKTFGYLLDEHALRGDVEKVFKEVLDDVLGKFRSAFSGKKKQQDGTALVTSLQRLNALSGYINLERKDDELFDNLTAILDARVAQNEGGSTSGSGPFVFSLPTAPLLLEYSRFFLR
jgi:hypothetical protein